VRSTLERGGRACEFHRSHTHADPDATALATRLEELVAKAETLAVQQRTGTLAARAATARKRKLRRGSVSAALRHLVRAGASAAKDAPELGGALRFPPENSTHQAFLTTARQMVELATANKEVLAKHGFTGPMLADLTAGLQALEVATTSGQAAAGVKAGARSELEVVNRQIIELIYLLDGINRHRFQDDAEALAEWATAISLVAERRRAKDGGVPPGGEGGLPTAA
jgi:hypothetical protein